MSANSSGFSQSQYHGGTLRGGTPSQVAICSGASFSIYVVRELIGAGSMASVYRAHDTRLRREVALKILNTGALAGADGVARFVHEARMAAAVRHPNVVSIFDVGVHDATPYIVMELLTGQDLDLRLNAARVLREPDLIDVARQLVSGLTAVHDAGIVHRDLRPSNVFLARGPDGGTQPKLLDFSSSKQTRDNLRLTTSGRRRWASMPLYTAPEILLDGTATFHSDQYSLGVLLYECVTGVNPFRADTVRESIELITAGEAQPIRAQALRPSRRLAAVIEKAMHVYPDQRFTDLRELQQALADLSGRRTLWPWRFGSEPRAARASSSPRGPSVRPSPRRAPRLGHVLGAAVVGCSIAAPVWAWWSAHRHRDAAPLSVAAPLAPTPAPAPASATVAPVAAPCVLPCPNPTSPGSRAPASSLPAAHDGLALSSPPAPESTAPSDTEPPEPPEPPSPELASIDSPALGDPNANLSLSESAAPETSPLDSGIAAAPDGGPAPPALPLPSAPSPNRHERGTNGALIFD